MYMCNKSKRDILIYVYTWCWARFNKFIRYRSRTRSHIVLEAELWGRIQKWWTHKINVYIVAFRRRYFLNIYVYTDGWLIEGLSGILDRIKRTLMKVQRAVWGSEVGIWFIWSINQDLEKVGLLIMEQRVSKLKKNRILWIDRRKKKMEKQHIEGKK